MLDFARAGRKIGLFTRFVSSRRGCEILFERIMQSTGSETAATPSPAPVRRDENAAVSKFRAAVLLFLWILAMVLATTVDRPVAEWVQAHRPLDKPTANGTYRGGKLGCYSVAFDWILS